MFIASFFNKECHIPELFVNDKFRGAGVGTFLILCVMAYADSHGLNIAKLYDASDNFNKLRNIYTNIGFLYDETNSHEMTGNVKEIYESMKDW